MKTICFSFHQHLEKDFSLPLVINSYQLCQIKRKVPKIIWQLIEEKHLFLKSRNIVQAWHLSMETKFGSIPSWKSWLPGKGLRKEGRSNLLRFAIFLSFSFLAYLFYFRLQDFKILFSDYITYLAKHFASE